jgi:hypothetical protein
MYRQPDWFCGDVFITEGTVFDVIDVEYNADYTQYLVKTEKYNTEVYLYGDEVSVQQKSVLKKGDGTENRRYVYVIVREDLTLADKLVQCSHATYESGQMFKNNADCISIIVLSVPDLDKLEYAEKYLKSKKIQYCTYTEQSSGLGKTAIATEAVSTELRSVFKKYHLLKAE